MPGWSGIHVGNMFLASRHGAIPISEKEFMHFRMNIGLANIQSCFSKLFFPTYFGDTLVARFFPWSLPQSLTADSTLAARSLPEDVAGRDPQQTAPLNIDALWAVTFERTSCPVPAWEFPPFTSHLGLPSCSAFQ